VKLPILPVAVAAFLVVTGQSLADSRTYDPKPWLDDLDQAKTAFATKYANLEWAVFGRQQDVAKLFDDTAIRIRTASDDNGARAAFDRLAARLGDGHVVFRWPKSGTVPNGASASLPCEDYNPTMQAAPLVARAQGYVPLMTPESDIFPAGVIAQGRYRVGVLKIGLFMARGTPALCKAALKALSIPQDEPCDDTCSDRVEAWAESRMTEVLMHQIEALKREIIDVLAIDIAGNGGGSEWAEAAARIVTPIRLKAERIAFMRGPHWAKRFSGYVSDLRADAKKASGSDRALLLGLANEAAAKKKVAESACDSTSLWKGEHPSCRWLGEGFYATGALASADPDWLRGKSWASDIFSPAQYPYREGVWRGPLIVVVDSDAASASEEFAAVLQDNHAALIVGEPTYGAGCGHTDGGTPTTLSNSHAVLELPDCVRLRADGSNEVRGVVPDLLLKWGHHDGPDLRAGAFLEALPEAIARALTQSHNW